MSTYTLEAGDLIYRLTCGCCGTEKNRVWGFVYKDEEAHGCYYALLNVTEEDPRVGLTLSVGLWWEGTEPSQRSWIHIDIRATGDKLQLEIRDPKDSNYYPWAEGGTLLTPAQVAIASELEEFRSVIKFVIETDVAISSYLSGAAIDTTGREQRDADQSLQNC